MAFTLANHSVPKYYLIGTKYQNSSGYWDDMFPAMVHAGSAAVGYARHLNLSSFFGQSEAVIVKHLIAQGEPQRSYIALKKFLQLRPGDLIALKGDGSPKGKKPYLHIVGYAEVSEDDAGIYSHDRALLGHLVKVEFLETDISKELAIGGYGSTVHRLSRADHIKKIFEVYSVSQSVAAGSRSPTGHSGTSQKNVHGTQVKSVRSYVKGAYHNQIQQTLFDQLCNQHGKAAVTMEKDFIDIRVEEKQTITLYEVKPFSTAKQCVREALGQLLEYSQFVSLPGNKQIYLVVVGPSLPISKEQNYIAYLSRILPIPFRYMTCKP